MTPQEAANRAAAALIKAEEWAAPGPVNTTGSALAAATVADSWAVLAEALAQNPIMVEKAASTAAPEVAAAFHEAYERLAPAHGYATREASAKPWDDVPEQNRALMVATVADLLDRGVITVPRRIEGSGL